MKKRLLKTTILIFVAVVSVFGQNQNYSFTANSLSVGTDRGRVLSNYGDFAIAGIDENGNSVLRGASYGSFSVTSAITQCIPCRKGTVFGNLPSGSLSWLTGGSAQNPPSEWTTFIGQISSPSWNVPIQHPRNRLLVKYVPVRLQGILRIVLNNGGNSVTYTDPDLDLSGIMRVEFRQNQGDPKLFEWILVQITASNTQLNR